MNGRVERWHRVLGDCLRSVLSGVDKLMWDWAARHVAYCFNRVRRKKKVKTPYFLRFGRPAQIQYLRRFGCPAFAKVHEKTGVLADRYEKGIHLGCSRVNSAYLFGVWRRNVAGNWVFKVIENSSLKFCEDVLVEDMNSLKVKDNYVLQPSGVLTIESSSVPA